MNSQQHIVLIGAGIMSASVGIFLQKLLPNSRITIYEALDRVAAESSDAWNNAGTGHSAYCELNYTPYINGQVDISKALEIAHRFEISKQLWAYLKDSGAFPDSLSFINPIPHMSLVWGEENIDFLKHRYQAMRRSAMFEDMIFSDDQAEIQSWIPLMMEGRSSDSFLAATRMNAGSDVNFGAITQGMIDYLKTCSNVEVYLGHQISDFQRLDNEQWELSIDNLPQESQQNVIADKVFIGAGGGTLPLLEKTDISEAHGYAGFPISGQFLYCTNPQIIEKHHAKVYGKAAVGSPPMSVPHLDTRYLDLPLSIEIHNVWPLLSAGFQNIDLTKYLIKQVTQSPEQRFAELQAYYPLAEQKDWDLIEAGQRVQIIKRDKESGGVLKFGTEIVSSEDGSITALLGASPGASTSVSIALDILAHMLPEQFKSNEWRNQIRSMIPSFGESLIENAELLKAIRNRSNYILGLSQKN